MSKYIESP